MTIDQSVAMVNDTSVVLDVAPTIINNRTYVPLRFVAESTGATVTWQGETRTIAIDQGDVRSYDQILADIYRDVYDEDGPDMSTIRTDYRKVYDQLMTLKSDYLKHDEKLKQDLIQLAHSCGLTLTEDMSLDEMTKKMYVYKTKQHEAIKKDVMNQYSVYNFDNGDAYYGDISDGHMKGLSYYQFASGAELIGQFSKSQRHGYLSEIDSTSFEYGYYIEDEQSGLIFKYQGSEDENYFVLTYYDEKGRQGISHRIAENKEHKKLYDAYFTYEDGVSTGLEYVNYIEGYELFDRGALSHDVVAQLNPKGNFHIAPTDEQGVADHEFTGFGYKRYGEGVEYIGHFEDWSLLGDGMYFAPEDTSDLTTNLMDQLANDILNEIIQPSMTEMEKVKVIHDYLANHIIYDPNPIAENSYMELSHTAYGGLINGVAVCDGYAESFKYLLDKVGIKNVLIFGEVDEDGNFKGVVNHAWNLIAIDGVYQHYDLTWNDDDVNQRVVYEYYNKKSDFFDDTHKWQQDQYIQYLE